MGDTAPPESLGTVGSALWLEITGTYDLRTDELVMLEFACVERDMEVEFRTAWNDEGRPRSSRGSMGQPVEHHLITSFTKHAKLCDTYLRQLKLPDEGGAKPNQQRDAGNARWVAAHGTGA